MVANPVLVKKNDESWRMYIDFTDLNKACPKDCYPFPQLDRLVDFTIRYDMFYFLDSFKGYHQMEMEESDKEKTFFIMECSKCYYKTMLFGLKNAEATIKS